MTGISTRTRDEVREDIAQFCRSGVDGGTLLAGAAARLREAVPFDGCFFSSTDPDTLMFTHHAVVEAMPATVCRPFFHNEFLTDDFNKFADLARRPGHVATLADATGGHLGRSARSVDINAGLGFAHEARIAFAVDGQAWAAGSLSRERGRRDFTAEERRLIGDVSLEIARGMRAAVLAERNASGIAPEAFLLGAGDAQLGSSAQSAADGLVGVDLPESELVRATEEFGASAVVLPAQADSDVQPLVGARGDLSGRLHFGADGEPTAADAGAVLLLANMDAREPMGRTSSLGFRIPLAVSMVAARARALAGGRGAPPPSAWLRLRTGVRMEVRAWCAPAAGGRPGTTEVLLRAPAGIRLSAAAAGAYGLSAREQEVAAYLTRGLPPADIAERMRLSAEALMRCIAVVHEKVGVTTRGALTARIFTEHYFDAHHAACRPLN